MLSLEIYLVTRGWPVHLCPTPVTSFGKRTRSHYPPGVVANRRDKLGDSEGLLVEVKLCRVVVQMAKEAAEALMNPAGFLRAHRVASILETTPQ
ncbi:hypothetical protein NPIL_157301 [Nephila pilipes]|uniref:Uncharacterized protein n=1 Tax=Nephila pilipes TaxID=299642 RepID=A0A8X6M635_NEPPI|nr:hypothetical protein NPIL_157301 [Nephila pilipes]